MVVLPYSPLLSVFLLGASCLSLSCSAGSDFGDDKPGDSPIHLGTGAKNGGGGIELPGSGASGQGGGSASGGARSEDCDQTLELTVRDFNQSHLDMERVHLGQDDVGCGIVASELFLGADGARTPVFQSPYGTGRRTITGGIISCAPWDYVPPAELTGEPYFNEWFSDVPGENVTFTVVLDLTEQVGPGGKITYVYDSKQEPSGGFFPADGQGFNEVMQGHNFHFTTEAHVTFGYFGGEKFTFSGDDDMWIFVNNRLALDLGGQHNALTATIDFDAQAVELGISPNHVYNMDIFHAERHTAHSNYRVETNIDCFERVEVPTTVIR